MIIKRLKDAPSTTLEGNDRVKKKIVIGPEDGSREIVLRHFSIESGGTSPHHAHDFPHLVRIESGRGTITDTAGDEHALRIGDYVYVNDNEVHHFTNTGSEPFEFICIVPIRGEG